VVQRVCQPVAIARRPEEALAPLWHTRLLLLLLLAAPSAAILLRQAPALSASSAQLVAVYAPILLLNAVLTLYVGRLGLGRWTFGELLGSHWLRAGTLFGDLAWAAALLGGLLTANAAMQSLPGFSESLAVHALVAKTVPQRLAWLLVGTVIGAAEELTYRGYLQRQLAGLSRSRSFGICAQALLFGIAHGERGGPGMLFVTLYGLAFGAVADARRSLLPGLLCHIAVDLSAGLSG
jgi:membrane protease YdiL (CAAX protease family)